MDYSVLAWSTLFVLGFQQIGTWSLDLSEPNVCLITNAKAIKELRCPGNKKTCKRKQVVVIGYEPGPGCCEGYWYSDGKCIFDPKHCPPGYTEFGDTCKPVCLDCTNGTCVKPEVCECNSGYQSYDGVHKCKPICEVCEHGTCIRPGVCECFPGFAWDEDRNNCSPVCEESCINGTCIAPNTCECLEGYGMKNASNICGPICNTCFGECVAPETCLVNCTDCEGSCAEGVCVCANGTACLETEADRKQTEAGYSSSPVLAGIQITWMLGGAIMLLLLVIIVVVIRHIYRKNSFDKKASEIDANNFGLGSVVYTVPNTLTSPDDRDDQDEDYDDLEPKYQNEMGLLPTKNYVERL